MKKMGFLSMELNEFFVTIIFLMKMSMGRGLHFSREFFPAGSFTYMEMERSKDELI